MNRSRLPMVHDYRPNEVKEPIEWRALSFPTLAQAAGVCPWDAPRLDASACGPSPGDGTRHAARFVLGVWDNTTAWRCGRFEAVAALACWDGQHRLAFMTWVARPWWE
jgi:hypothetical protein